MVQYYLRIAYDDHDTTFLRANGNTSTPTADEAAARAAPFTFTVESRAVQGQWGPVFKLPNVAIHTHVLPNGRVLMWGRRDKPDIAGRPRVHAFSLGPGNAVDNDPTTDPPQPTLADGTTKVNLFCSGHAFLPDGRLLVVGGHLEDSDGVNQASTLYPGHQQWTPTALMNKGRWYPTATTLPDGSVLVLAGSYKDNGDDRSQYDPSGVEKRRLDSDRCVSRSQRRVGALPSHARRFRWSGLHVRPSGENVLVGTPRTGASGRRSPHAN